MSWLILNLSYCGMIRNYIIAYDLWSLTMQPYQRVSWLSNYNKICCWRRQQQHLPGHAEVAGTGNCHDGVRHSTKDQLVETSADMSILPKWERVLVFCVTEADEQVCRTKSPHDWAGFTPSIPQKYLREGIEER